jgi:hypothetical protein
MKKLILGALLLLSISTNPVIAGCGPIIMNYTFPSNNTTNVNINTKIKFLPNFNKVWPNNDNWCQEGVKINNGYLRIIENATNLQVDSIKISDIYGLNNFTHQDTLTFQPNIILKYCTTYRIILDAGSIDAISCCLTGQGQFDGWRNSQYQLYNWTFTTANHNIIVTSTIIPTMCDYSCDGSASVSASGGSGSYSYLWNNLSTNQQISNVCKGQYSVTINDNNYIGCKTIKNIQVTGPDSIHVSYQMSPSQNGTQILTTISGGTPLYNILWSGPNNFNSNNNNVYNVQNGIYTLYVSDLNNCKDTTVFNIGDTGTIEQVISTIVVSPNPANDEIKIEGISASMKASKVEITNIEGKVVASKEVTNSSNFSFDLDGMKAGIYFVNVTHASGVETVKFIKN